MQKVSRFEASSAVQKGATLMSGVRVSKITRINRLPTTAVTATDNTQESKPDNMIDIDPQKARNGSVSDSELALKGRWELFGTGGVAALHDTAESCAAAAEHYSLGIFDAVIVTGNLKIFRKLIGGFNRINHSSFSF